MKNWMKGVRVRRGLLSGILAWCVGFALYLVPSFVVAFQLSFELGRQGQNAAAISSQISQRIPTMYAGSWLLNVSLIVATSVVVFWRARILAREAHTGAAANGLIVGTVAATFTVLLFLGFGAFGWPSISAVVAYISAGMLGGVSGRAAGATTS